MGSQPVEGGICFAGFGGVGGGGVCGCNGVQHTAVSGTPEGDLMRWMDVPLTLENLVCSIAEVVCYVY